MTDLQDTSSDNKQISYDGVNGSPYDDPEWQKEMRARYWNYNPDTNTFTIEVYLGLGEKKDEEILPNEFEQLNAAEHRHYRKLSPKEKWIIKTVIEDYSFKERRFDDIELKEFDVGFDYENGKVIVEVYHVPTEDYIREDFDLDILNAHHKQMLESEFEKDVKEDFVDRVNRLVEKYVEGCFEDFLSNINELEKDREEYQVDDEKDSLLIRMKSGFTSWLEREDEEFEYE